MALPVVAPAAAPAAPPAPAPAGNPRPSYGGAAQFAFLVFRTGSLKGQRIAIRTPVVNIGRADYNDIVLPDDSVSTQHAKLQRREGVWTLVDLESTNGTIVDGEKVTGDVPLGPGALIRFGDVQAAFEPTDDALGVSAGKATSVLKAMKFEPPPAPKAAPPPPPLPARAGPQASGSAGGEAGRSSGSQAGRKTGSQDAGETPGGTASAAGEEGQRVRVQCGGLPAEPFRRGQARGLVAGLRDLVKITCAARTDVGVIRSGNEDNFLVLADQGVFIVADGMGGHAAGEVASEMAVRLIAETIGNTSGLSDEQLAQRERDAISAANSAIFQRTVTEPEKRGMGTTVTAMVMRANRFLIGQVGDSRAYILRDDRLVQITKDHSYVQEQVDAGHLTPEQARTHPYSNVITRCVGANAEVVPDLYLGAARKGDVFLLASDGLTGMLEDHELLEVLRSESAPQKQVEGLIEAANRRGGLDNITAIIVRVDEVDAPEGTSEVTQERPAVDRDKGRRTSGETTASRT